MEGWEVWSTNNEVFDAVFPCLRELEIVCCPKLIEVSLKPLLSVEILRFINVGRWKGWPTNREVLVLPRLRKLHIVNCRKMIEFSPKALPALETLRFEDMLGWKTWSTNVAVFPSLRKLHIINCPELIDVSAEALPSLRVLEIAGCGDGVLRSLVRAASSITKLTMSSISGLTYEVWRGVIEHIGAVEEVRIVGCDEIRYLWESEEEASKVLVNIKKLEEDDNLGGSNLSSLRMLDVRVCSSLTHVSCPNNIESLHISYCSSLTHVSCPNNIESLRINSCSSLTHVCCPNNIESLHINSCRSLTHVSFPTAATGGGGGQKLKSLRISGCEKLMEKISSASMPILESIYIKGWTNLKSIMQLGNFIYLTELHLISCPSIESFPDIQLPLLTHLEIEDCESMESLSALQMKNLTSLKKLTITNCRGIDVSCHCGVWPPNLCSLYIGGLKKPMSEWGPQKFPASLVELYLYDEPDVRNFRQLSHLFPSSLTHLWITDFRQLSHLSMGLQHLTSLQHLTIGGARS
ncbi:putative leucine-rich repeat domain superfamily [Helianthus annuus]|nr:putative leucine-rich repeat domain superfamily [Helianthus annuus]KAJ0860892.1 putative leucine-rich repeat domain superfamily [Helianthus annuus]